MAEVTKPSRPGPGPGPGGFTIGQDSRVTKSSLISVSKKDYPMHNEYKGADIAKPPRLGDIMHSDNRICERTSETVTSFFYRPMAKPVLKDIQNTLRMTNFKMDRDLSKLNVFATTTTNYYFQPKPLTDFKVPVKGAAVCPSYIPQGDPEKADKPLTLYREEFPGHDPKMHPVLKAPCMHQGTEPTIKGDKLMHCYKTSYTDHFQGKWLPPPTAFPPPTVSNIPSGDQDKEHLGETIMQSSFVDNRPAEMIPYNREAVGRKKQQTHFNLRDHHGEWDDFKSIASVSYQPKVMKTERMRPVMQRNHSSIPEGDRDPARDSSRVNYTSYHHFMGTPSQGFQNSIVSGANLRTHSNVWFGEPALGGKYYNTTSGQTFQPKFVPFINHRKNLTPKSVVPLDYYKDDVSTETTMSKDYVDHKATRLIPLPAGIDRIKNCHIVHPLDAKSHISTTHNDTFTPKSVEKHIYDSGRMQRSSVPLGTLA